MIIHYLKFMFAGAALMATTMAAVASTASDTSNPSCRQPLYSREALRNSEEGVTYLALLVRADGTVASSVVLISSGFADLDRETQRALSRCTLEPATVGGKAVERWVPFQNLWSLEGNLENRHAQHDTAIAAIKGDLAARYRLSGMLLGGAKTDAEREHAIAVLRSAADLGFAHAQFELGERYEKGDLVKADIEEALRWYQKAAAQGHVLAIQRLQVGALPE